MLETFRLWFTGRVPNPTEPLWGFRFLTCPRNGEWIIDRILVPGTQVKLLGHGVHIKERSGVTALKSFVVS